MTTSSGTARQLAEWGTGPLAVPARVREAAVQHLLDGFGTALAAVRLEAARPAVTVARGLGGPPEAAVLGEQGCVGAPAAALANGTLIHALDYDDTHAVGLVHATAVVLPAAFAVGQQTGATGTQVLEAAVVGYETVCRVAAAAPHGFHARGLHATMVAGVLSSAMVTARLLGLSADVTTSALGIAGSSAGGLLSFLATGASTKQLHPGLASQAGILAARLAAAGATGPDTVLDGPHGLYQALASGPVDPAGVVAGLGESWQTELISIKLYPACQLSHVTLGALGAALAREPFGADDVESVTADVHPDAASVVCDASRDLIRPLTPYAAKFSLPWSAAALLVDGRFDLETFSDASIVRPDVTELAARIGWTVVRAPGVAADAPGRVTVRLRDGREVVGEVPGRPEGGRTRLPREALLAKLTANVGSPATELVELVEALDRLTDVHGVLAAANRAAIARSIEAGAAPA